LERDKEDNVRHELDNQFAALRELIYAPDPSSSGSNSVPLGTRENAFKTLPAEGDPDIPKLVPEDGDYDQHVRELAFDKRSKPKDRTKTEEELAIETKEALEKAERKRRKRMLGLDESDEEEDSGKGRNKRKRGADDLDDDFEEEIADYDVLGAGLEGAPTSEGEDEEGSGEEGTSEGDSEQEDDEEDNPGEDSSDIDGGDEDREEGEHEQLVAPSRIVRNKTAGKKSPKQELPFTFPCPENHDEFLEILGNVDDRDVPVVIQRIRALYHTSLGADNKFKLQVRANLQPSSALTHPSLFIRHLQQYLLITSYMFRLHQRPVLL
jgi:nucleolar protein 14